MFAGCKSERIQRLERAQKHTKRTNTPNTPNATHRGPQMGWPRHPSAPRPLIAAGRHRLSHRLLLYLNPLFGWRGLLLLLWFVKSAQSRRLRACVCKQKCVYDDVALMMYLIIIMIIVCELDVDAQKQR
jgi:hypothetical protein